MAAGQFQGTYSAEQVIITIGGVIVTGFADGDFCVAKYADPRYTAKAGADGEVGRSKTASRMGTIEITLSHTSAANAELSDLFKLGMVGGTDAVVPITVADLSGGGLVTASAAWLDTAPDFTRGKEISDAVWLIGCADLSFDF